MQIKISLLDGRHSGNAYFKYRAQIQATLEERHVRFNEIREWCWQVWGSSAERESHCFLTALANPAVNLHWAWHVEDQYNNFRPYIYLVGDEELAFFKLKW